MTLKFFNTLDRKLEEFKPLHNNEVRMYTCGPTVYNFAHIGNFRAYMFEDLLRRTFKYFGYKVTQVMNLTDVDDKTIRDSQAAGMSLENFTGQYKQAFFEDLETLNIDPAEFYPAATDHIAEMIELIQVLVDKGYGYQAEDGSVYYRISKFPEYGKLAKIDMENQRAGVRVKTDEYAKDSVADFALWKAWDQNDGDVCWESPWGKGRPGWHIECSAMAMKYLGKTFDMHTGGIDNMFPHHEDEIAQSEAANGCRYVNYWLHCAHLIVNGDKMSKSAGNFYTLRDCEKKGYSGQALRWVLLGAHYRKKLNFTFEACDQAEAALKKFSDLFVRLKSVSIEGNGAEAETIVQAARSSFKAALGDDLNISEALAAVYGLQHEVNKLMDAGKLSSKGAQAVLEQFRDFDRVFALFNVDEAVKEDIPDAILEMARKRFDARKNKDFATADAMRDQLKEAGWTVEDAADGFRVKPL
ncbi:cysteine--tRNA ligase [Lentisphaerota bacterium ZTH]|nr:cysteine--tRNA ligase [Lentisphaerota bacterium]WET05956.1 cysteine--tRNA ligase [Lentisphaerota bacterium ZTH]